MDSGWPLSLGVGRRLRARDDLARYALQLIALTAAYAVTGKLGLNLAFAQRSVSAIWPPTGIALAALVLGGYRLWPGVALGALLANLNTGVLPVTLFGIVCGNTLEALAGAFLLRGVARFRPSLERVTDVLALVVFGAMISTLVSATIGVTSLLIGGATSWSHAPMAWRTWWLGDVGGDLIVAPAILIAATHREYRWLRGRWLEAAFLALLLAGISVVVFSHTTNVVYALFPLLIWAALRFWQPGAAGASLIVGAIAISFTADGNGPFAMSNPDDRLILAQTFVAVAGVTALVLAAVTSERRRAEDAEREIAETLQRSLLPAAAPRISGWEIATLYRPAGAAEVEVGGDFYDFFETPAGWVVLIGDVVGKGVEAAAMAGLVRHGARFVSQTEDRPAAILGRLNDAVHDQPALWLCSALCAYVHWDHMLLSSAGHPGPIVVRPDGRIREIGGAGPMLGIYPHASWPERVVRVGRDETVLLYTDGVTDTRGESGRFGHRRLTQLLTEHAELSPHDLLAELEWTLERFQLGPQSDDTAALALRIEGTPASRRRRPRSSPRRGGPRSAEREPSFQLETAVRAGTVTIKVIGEIDHGTAERLIEAFERSDDGAGSQLVLDLTGVTFVDSAGLRTLVGIERRASERSRPLRIVWPPEHIRAVFRLSGAEGLLQGTGHPDTQTADFESSLTVSLELPVSSAAPSLAREEIREAIAGMLPVSGSESAVLLTSELVTNAVVHPDTGERGFIGLKISSDVGRVRVEVSDSGSGFDPAALRRDSDAYGGRGLVIVDRAATRWGVSRGERFSVWFELFCDQAR